nr:hypothetical protein Iba_scaffold37209CG0010 [Ipomoea batatas]GMD89883.1 hypothetical protein Iba_chr14dCG4340 [Ipomoea batatas]
MILSKLKLPEKFTSIAVSSISPCMQIHAFPAPQISPPSTRLALIPYKSATQLSVLKVKLAEMYENGTQSIAATAPASLFLITVSYAIDTGSSLAK